MAVTGAGLSSRDLLPALYSVRIRTALAHNSTNTWRLHVKSSTIKGQKQVSKNRAAVSKIILRYEYNELEVGLEHDMLTLTLRGTFSLQQKLN